MADHVHTTLKFDGMDDKYKRVLIIVIFLNGIMFFVEYFAGHIGGSLALQADALDFASDTLTFMISFMVIGWPVRMRSLAAILKGLLLLGLGLWILGSTLYRVTLDIQPEAYVMTWIGALALCANLATVGFLFRYRNGDSNVRSVWQCSRNDAIGNVAIIGAGFAVAITASRWPDLIVAFGMAALFTNSAYLILKQAAHEFATNSIDYHDHSPEAHSSAE